MKFSIHDWTGGFRALKKEVFLKEREELTNYKGYIFQISFLQKAIRDGFKIGEVPFHFSDRALGRSKIAPIGYILEVFKFVIITRIQEILFGKFGKFLVVGGTGFIINWAVLNLLFTKFNFRPEIANLAGAALAIFSNYNLNNLWTFEERKANNLGSYLLKMLQFYATSSFGVIFIQTGTIFILGSIFGRENRLLINLYFIIGTGLLLIWNFTVYNKIIWRKEPQG